MQSAAEIARLLGQCQVPVIPPSPQHICPLSFPPPSSTSSSTPSSPSKRRRRQRRRKRSSEPELPPFPSTEIEEIVTSIRALTVTGDTKEVHDVKERLPVVKDEEEGKLIIAEVKVEDKAWPSVGEVVTGGGITSVQVCSSILIPHANPPSCMALPVTVAKSKLLDSGIYGEEALLLPKIEMLVKEEVNNNLLASVVMSAKQPVRSDLSVEFPSMFGPCRIASDDELWLDQMVSTIDDLAENYAPHPIPYQGKDGCLHSADVKPPHVDFSALGYHARRLPTPSAYPIQSCAQDAAFYESPPSSSPGGWQVPNQADWKTFPFGYLPGFYTTKGIIAVPSQLFGHAYGREHGGPLATWYMCAT